MQIKLRAFDTLFFRDGKPFSRGEEVWANGMFPPPPSVVYGAMRTAFFSRNLDALPMAGTDDDPSAQLSINALFLHKNDKVYLPCPYDLVQRKGELDNHIGQLNLQDFSSVSSSLPSSFALCPPLGFAPAIPMGGRHYVTLDDFIAYISEAKIPEQCVKTDVFFVKEPKIGLTRSTETGSAEEGKLYRVELFRPRADTGIFIDYSTDGSAFSLPDAGFFNMGGEGKSVQYALVEKKVEIPRPHITGKRFKIVVCTPAFFENGWLPSGFSENLEGNWCGHSLKILAVALDRPLHLGGFDMKNNRPKSMSRAVSAGAVYYVETEEEDVNAVAKSFHGHCLSEFGMDRQGYGLSFVGNISSSDQLSKNA
ncbi:type III-B CRISPR module-associated protein Cmr3 [Haliscomenobacter hydrossis]|uniref:CRISPR-associated protein, Cmr3 family n=1 Tax=Haliscomenobacter hydrossis (strain ATCC 27775 / DSM 1100 / LMG 10767 / O) TaxID=760192 RepID=F4L2J9_HALH1|nr:type III-B CRISPR module-associated protein Cmr3 [Haliscomenobacter hydrossis]AEE53917.1 CRISPR-associated protein, Cmr3 family [Haliscomenobacter hydrossis DSM 1100]